ncbi:MAG: energy-coupling factor transporter transmembrane component T [Candidatus Izemoplasmatales bacterium]|nr:energy-coupling factor transporter transmembrane component T [Candidatus Izemoplasmatales bacterium]
MKNIVIGQYVPGEGFFYKLDPRTKIISIVFLMVSLFLLESITYLLIAFGLSILLLIAGKLSILRILKGLKPIFILLIFTFIFQIMFNKEGTLLVNQVMRFSVTSIIGIFVITVIWRFLAKYKRFNTILFFLYLAGLYFLLARFNYGAVLTTFPLMIYQKGLEMSVFVVIRLIIIITLSTVLTITTKPTDLTQGLEKLMRPLKIIGIKSEDFALIISISLRYIPTILDEANKIMLAQASRGSDFTEGKLKDKVKQVISLLVPMFIIAFKRSEDLADAMESRNFIPGKPRTRIFDLKFSYIDLFTTGFTLLCFATSIYLKVI